MTLSMLISALGFGSRGPQSLGCLQDSGPSVINNLADPVLITLPEARDAGPRIRDPEYSTTDGIVAESVCW